VSAGPWARLVALLGTTEGAASLALFRAFTGLVLVLNAVHLWGAGTLLPLLTDAAHGGYRPLDPDHWLVSLLGGATPTTAWALSGASFLGGLLMVVGLGGRGAVLLAWLGTMALFALNADTGGGHDRVLTNALYLLLLAPSTRTLSLDCWLRAGRLHDAAARVAAWPRWVGIYQLVLIYGTTGVQKLGLDWFPMGDWLALYYALQLPSWQRVPMEWVARPPWLWLTQAGTAATWAFEVLSPLLLGWFWLRRTAGRGGWLRRWALRFDLRRLYALVGLLLHMGIWATMDVGPFSPAMLAWYFLLFRPAEIEAAPARWGIGRAPAAQGAAIR
jgi:hypothetical protein